jgi:hypothetical protein
MTGSQAPGGKPIAEGCEHEWMHVVEYDNDTVRNSLVCRCCGANAGNNIRTRVYGTRVKFAQHPEANWEMTYRAPSGFVGTGMNQWHRLDRDY